MAPMTEESTYAVLLSKPEGCEPVVLAKALAAVRKTPLQDQMPVAKGAWGIVAQHLNDTDAMALVHGLASLGIESMRCPEATLASLPEAEPVKTWAALPVGPRVLSRALLSGSFPARTGGCPAV